MMDSEKKNARLCDKNQIYGATLISLFSSVLNIWIKFFIQEKAENPYFAIPINLSPPLRKEVLCIEVKIEHFHKKK